MKQVGLVAYMNNDVLALSCKNELGEDLDWYMLLKPPKDRKNSNGGLAAGLAYGYMESKNPGPNWKLAMKNLNQIESFIGRTFAEVYKNPEIFSYIQYNDGKPEGFGDDSSTYAHAKGVLVWNNENAIWLVHSVPKFLPDFRSKRYGYPVSGRGNGQNFLCVTVDTKKYVDKILAHIAIMKAQIYTTHIAEKLDKTILEKIAPISDILLAEKQKKIETSTNHKKKTDDIDLKKFDHLITEFKTKNLQQKFTAYVKSRQDNVDVWSTIAANVMKAKEFVVRTWTMGQPVGNLLGATCMRNKNDKKASVDVLNVVKMTLNFENSNTSLSWKKKDHSKWGVCTSGGDHCYCAGDMNRATSQFKRGGGAVCIHNANVNQAWKKTITNKILCSQKTEHPENDDDRRLA